MRRGHKDKGIWSNPEALKLLKQLWAEGLSGSQIACRIPGASRAAIIGKVHRLGLSGRVFVNNRRYQKPKRNRKRSDGVRKPAPVKLPTEDIEKYLIPHEQDIPTKTLDEIDDFCCKYRIDKPFKGSPYGFCGKEAVIGLRWCEGHLPRVFDNWPAVLHKAKEKAREKETV